MWGKLWGKFRPYSSGAKRPEIYPIDFAGGRTDAGFARNATDQNLKAWLSAGAVDRGVGDGLTYVASAVSARQGIGTWILRFRFGGRQREKVLGRYPAVSLKEARELARMDRSLLQQGTDVAAYPFGDRGVGLACVDAAFDETCDLDG